VFNLPSSWVWDFWLADDGERFHLFFLKASRALQDPDRRHWRATVGHAISTDLTHWTEVADALVPSDGPAFDDLATWTGSVVRAPDGTWRMFYTGVNRAGGGMLQRIGGAMSTDLHTWTRVSDGPLTSPDPKWYEQLSEGKWPDEAWRDPWVFEDPDGDGWHMLVTARANEGDAYERGVVGHARSDDLNTWTVGPPLSLPGAGFGQLEVLQVATIEERHVMLFSCESGEMSEARRAREGMGGIWAVNLDKITGPYDVAGAYQVHDESLYVGRLVQDRNNQWVLLAFRNLAPGRVFIGEITDPMPVSWGPGERLRIG
jgi:beta-fructofuranosidase